MFGKRLTRALAITTVASLVLATAAFAQDQLLADGDALTPVAANALNLGSVCPGGAITANADNVLIAVNANNRSAYPWYKNSTAVTISATGVPVALTLTGLPDTIQTPGSWETISNGSQTTSASGRISLANAGTTTGANSASVSFTSVGAGWDKVGPDVVSVTALERTTSLTVNWTVLQATDPACAPANTAPTVDAGPATYSGNEGSAISVNGSASDDGPAPLTLAWTATKVSGHIDAVCNFADASLAITTVTCNDNGIWTLRLTATDGGGLSSFDEATLTVSNVAPTAVLSNAGPGTEGSGVSVSFSGGDDASILDVAVGLTYAFACDGTTFGSALSISSTTCTFGDNGSFGVKGRVFDKDGDFTEYTTTVTVLNALPVVATPSWASTTLNCGQVATLQNISFSDAGLDDDPWSLAIAWGDGSADYTDTNVLVQGTYANQSHTYTAPGTYEATVTVTDKDGGVGSASTATDVTINQFYITDFLAPLDDSTPSQLIANTMKKGRVVPVKVTILDNCTGEWVNDPLANVTISVKTAAFTTNSTDAVESFSDAGASSGQTTAFRWSADTSVAGGGYWIYNLDSSGLTIGTTYQVAPRVGTVLNTSNFAILKPTK